MPILCGEVHYFRVPRKLWRDRLLKLKRAGANCVSSYIPWNWHMPREDIVNFEDLYREWYVAEYYSRELREYLKLARELGLRFIARPGPYICSEWDSGGHPNWLYAKTRRFRSKDPVYMQWALKWYRALFPLLAEYSDIIALVQVENEYFWGNEAYIEELKREVERSLPSKLVVTNENWYLTKTPNTLDSYPAPWDIEGFDEKLQKYVESQPELFKMFMELGGGWFTANRYGYVPTNRLSIPASWTETLLKTSIASGVFNVNVYMFHGGSNPGYYTGKYITTSYDYEAPIREWGELSPRYYAIKRVYAFMKSFSNLLEESKQVKGLVKPLYSCTDALARLGKSGGLVVLRNFSDTACYQKLSYRDMVIPLELSVRVHPKYAKLMLLDYVVEGSPFIVKYSTSEPLLKLNYSGTTILVLYSAEGEESETLVEFAEPFEIKVYGDVYFQLSKNAILLKHVQKSREDVVALRSRRGALYLVYTSSARADKSWLLDELEKPLVLLSNIYYVGEVRSRDDVLELEVELDESSCGPALLIGDISINELRLNGKRVGYVKVFDKFYYFDVPEDVCRLPAREALTIGSFQLREDTLDYEYVELKPGTPLEEAGFYSNGLYVYKILFSVDRGVLEEYSNKGLALVGVNDYAVVLVNGVYAGSGYHVVEALPIGLLREGVNEVTAIVESTGHVNDGLLYVPNGITEGLYVGIGERILLRKWKKISAKLPLSSEFDIVEFMEKPAKLIDISSATTTSSEVEFPEGEGLYVKDFYLDKVQGHYVLDFGYGFYQNYPPKVLVFINGAYLGPYRGVVDVTEHLKPGWNKIAVYLDWGALQPVLRRYDMKIGGKWLVQEGTRGLREKWFSVNWQGDTAVLPLDLSDRAGRVLWLKATFNVDQEPTSSSPLRLVAKSSGLRLLVFVNGNLIGRLYDETPQRELYVPEVALKKCVNEIVLMAITTSKRSVLESIKLENYYVHVNAKLTATK